jgi:hypothetical protein
VIQSARTFHFSVALSFCLLYVSIFMLIPQTPLLNDPDTFWHIRTGQWILDHWQFPTTDVFSYTAAGNRWISTEWLSEVIFAIAFKAGGWQAVVVLAAITICCRISGFPLRSLGSPSARRPLARTFSQGLIFFLTYCW